VKRKKLSKKIRRLEARLQKGTKKLAKLRRKLEAVAASGTAKKKRKSAAIEERSVAKKAKRKLNLTPERRAQLAAAMKARWAAKRAASGANTQSTSPEPGFTLGPANFRFQ
jgi:hypothetical protein